MVMYYPKNLYETLESFCVDVYGAGEEAKLSPEIKPWLDKALVYLERIDLISKFAADSPAYCVALLLFTRCYSIVYNSYIASLLNEVGECFDIEDEDEMKDKEQQLLSIANRSALHYRDRYNELVANPGGESYLVDLEELIQKFLDQPTVNPMYRDATPEEEAELNKFIEEEGVVKNG